MRLKSKEVKRWLLGLAVSIGGILIVAVITDVVRAQFIGPPVWKEFTFVYSQSTRTLPDGVPFENLIFEAHRRDGSRVHGTVAKSGLWGGTRTIKLAFPPRDIVVDELMRMKSTFSRKTGRDAPLRDPLCGFSQMAVSVKPINKGVDEVLGFHTVMLGTEEGDGEYLHTAWKAPDLDCLVMKVSEDRRNKAGEITGHFDGTPIQVSIGPPDPNLFETPLDYEEVAPSKMKAARGQAFGIPPPTGAALASIQRQDIQYQQSH